MDSGQENAFQVKSDIPYMDFTISAFWMELNVENTGSIEKNFTVELGRPLTNEIDVYLVNKKSDLIKEYHAGDDFVFDKRTHEYRKFVFPLTFDADSKYTLFVRAESDGEILKLQMKFWSNEGFTEFVSKENFFLGFFYGFITVVVLLFTFFGIALREKIYFYFISYVSILGMF